jgi:multidrug resistance efflux pump
MIAGGATAATVAVVGHHNAKKQFESMQKAQQAQINRAEAQAAQAEAQAAQAEAQAAQTNQAQGKKDVIQELEKLANLKKQGILSDEEFQQMKARLLSSS